MTLTIAKKKFMGFFMFIIAAITAIFLSLIPENLTNQTNPTPTANTATSPATNTVAKSQIVLQTDLEPREPEVQQYICNDINIDASYIAGVSSVGQHTLALKSPVNDTLPTVILTCKTLAKTYI